MLTRFTLALAAGLAAVLPGHAVASPIVHDSAASFATLGFNPGGPVAPARRDANAMFDGVTGTMRSLGVGGTMTAGIAAGLRITEVTFTELTFGVFSNHREQAVLSLAFDGDNDGIADGAWTEIGTLRNDEWRNPNLPPVAQTVAGTVGTLTGTFDRDLARFTLTVHSGEFNLLRLVDGSPALRGRDGFDIAEFRVRSEAVPEPTNPVPAPAGLALFGLGLAGLVAARRRAQSA